MQASRRFAALIPIVLISYFAGSAQAQERPHVTPWTPRTGSQPPKGPVGPPKIALSSSAWTLIGPGPLNAIAPFSGRITGIAAHPTVATTLYVSPAGGGV